MYDEEERKILEKIELERRPAKKFSVKELLAKKIEGLITPPNEEVKLLFDASIKF